MNVIYRIFICCVILFSCASSKYQVENVDEYVRNYVDRIDGAGLSIVVVKEGNRVFSGNFGYANKIESNLVNEETRFLIASLTKPITATAVMLLQEEGLCDIDEDINNYLPFNVVNPHYSDSPITLRMLLTHTSSIKDVYNNLNKFGNESMYKNSLPLGGPSEVSLDQMCFDVFNSQNVFRYKSCFTKSEPGSSFEYSNLGYALAGYIVESITEEDFREYCTRKIFNPLGMNSTTFYVDELNEHELAIPYNRQIDLSPYSSCFYPCGFLYSTTDDYLKFIMIFMDPDYGSTTICLSSSSISEMLIPQIDNGWALGWTYCVEFGVSERTGRFVHHTGHLPGAATFTAFDPEAGNIIIVFKNHSSYFDSDYKYFYYTFCDSLMDYGDFF